MRKLFESVYCRKTDLIVLFIVLHVSVWSLLFFSCVSMVTETSLIGGSHLRTVGYVARIWPVLKGLYIIPKNQFLYGEDE